ncbi:MAG: exodeoxyribonuclease VII large subunit [Chitinispirillaceae bacterium]|nr:exodeoxyribonuclease VII large subunit [Chitinispirillaceae bacterium]
MNPATFTFLTPHEAERPYTISEINDGISLILESGNTLVWVEGEISNWKVASSGHSYFKLKDRRSQIPAVMWRQSLLKLEWEPEDGMAVLVIASIRVYRKTGYYQLDCVRMEPRGRGALSIAFEKLKDRLEKEGLFDHARKKPLPDAIARVGVVTSRSGAAIRDIVRIIASRAPQIDITLADTPVQGAGAALKIAQAIRDLNQWGGVDCIIVGRGGGSIEDLWPFNEEPVARAIYDSAIPVISAVGHEIDFTISDFVADLRAPTPSAAAEMVAPDREEQTRYMASCGLRFSSAMSRILSSVVERYDTAVSSRAFARPIHLLLENQQEYDDHAARFCRAFGALQSAAAKRLSSDASRLNALSPLAVLSRGYCVATTADGNVVKHAAALSVGQDLALRFHSGAAQTLVTSISSPAMPQ